MVNEDWPSSRDGSSAIYDLAAGTAAPTEQRRQSADSATKGELYCIVCTFRREEALRETLRLINEQSFRPSRVIVVDNGSSESAREIARSMGVHYMDAGNNLGPAGGFALGMSRVLETASDDDWIVTSDDDDPPETQERFEHLWSLAQAARRFDKKVAAVGTNGARYNYQLGRFYRVPDEQLIGPVSVDYLAGSQFHSCAALRQVGLYRAELFFGLEEAEYGLRARKEGWSLYAHGDAWLGDRVRAGRLGLSHVRTKRETAAWRRYYSSRNAVLLAREYGSGRWGAALAALRAVVGGTWGLFRDGRPLGEVAMPFRGAVDGFLRRLGRTVDPGLARKTN